MYDFQAADYKLADLLGVAGATVGIIIATGILMGMIVARYRGIFERYHMLGEQLRDEGTKGTRRTELEKEVISHRRQAYCLNTSSMLLAVAVLVFIIVLGLAGLSIVFPQAHILRLTGTVGLFVGLLFITTGILLMLFEMWTERGSISKETEDLQGLPSFDDARK
jgi:hypothetical protein